MQVLCEAQCLASQSFGLSKGRTLNLGPEIVRSLWGQQMVLRGGGLGSLGTGDIVNHRLSEKSIGP